MLSHDSLDIVQKGLYDALLRAINENDIVLVGYELNNNPKYDDSDAQRVLSTWVEKENGITFLTLPATRTSRKVETDNRKKIIEAIWDKASTNVRNIWINLHTENLHDQGDIISYLTEQQKGESDTGAYNDIIQKIQEHQQSVGAGSSASSKANATPATPPLLQQDGQPQEEGSMLSYDDLDNDEQKELYRDLKSTIKSGSYKSVFGAKLIVDINAVLGARIIEEDGFEHNFLTYAIKHSNEQAAENILHTATTTGSLNDLLKNKLMVRTYEADDGCDIPFPMTALDYAREQKNTEFEQLIIKYMGFERMPVPARQNLPPFDEGSPASSETGATSAAQSDPQQGGHDQQRDGIRNLYIQLYSNIVNGNIQTSKDSLNALLKQDNEKFKKVVDFKERGIVSLRENIQQKLQDLEYNKGDQELIEILETCVGRINLIDAKLEDLDQQQAVNPGSPVSSETSATSATLPHILQGGQHQQGRTSSFSSSISSDGSDDEDKHQGAPKTPTCWDKNKGKIAVGTIGALLLIGGIVASVVAANPTVVAFAIAAAVLGAIMLGGVALAKTTDKGEKMWDQAGKKLSGLLVSNREMRHL